MRKFQNILFQICVLQLEFENLFFKNPYHISLYMLIFILFSSYLPINIP